MRFKDKVVVVTGGGSGIGLAVAKMFAVEGAIVAVNDNRKEAADAAVAEIERDGGRAISIVGDVSQEAEVRANARQVIDQFGRIDVLISNAGVPMNRIGQPEEQARTMLFLASDDASYITGHTIPVDGGQMALYSGAPSARGTRQMAAP